MLRGILLGVSWGGLVAAVAVTTVSLVYSNANRPPVADQSQEAALVARSDAAVEPVSGPAVGTAPAQGGVLPAANEADASLAISGTPQVTTDAPASPASSASDQPPADSDVVTHSAPKVMIPSESDSQGMVVADQEGAPVIMGANDAPASPSTSAALPEAPLPESQPEAQSEARSEARSEEGGQTDAMSVAPMQDAPSEGDTAQAELPLQPDSPDVQVSALPQITTPDQAQTPEPDGTMAVPSPESAAPATNEQPQSPLVSVPKITNLAPNVKTNRLPTIGGTTEAEGVEAGQEITPEADTRALSNYAMAFDNPDAKPMFSVVLIDDPLQPISDDVLSHLPFALSFAIDAVRDDAHAVAARYRAAGFEVLMLTNLPFGANATDVEVAFGAYSRAIPEAIAVLDLGANGFLRGPATATQIAGIMSEKGFGLITPSKGLNSAQKAAMREGVPAVLVFRELDVDGENPSVIRRYLDRAAFRAAQEGSVIMLGHTRPDTIEALVTWALEDRAASVAIAPVSAVLLAQ